MIHAEELPNGNLKIILDDSWKRLKTQEEIKKFLLQKEKKVGTDAALKYLIKKLPGYKQVWPEETGDLTAAVIIVRAKDSRTNPKKKWWSSNYMIVNEIEELCEKGYFIFNGPSENCNIYVKEIPDDATTK